jgi:multiple sugar transport system permease protein
MLTRLRPSPFWSFVGPFLIGLLLFTFVPIAWGFVLSFFRAYNTVHPTEFIGLENYRALLASEAFRNSLVTGVVYTFFIVPVAFLGALGLASLVNRLPVGTGISRTIFFLPAACSFVVGALIWRMNIFNGLPYGLANQVLHLFGIPAQAWIGTAQPPLYWVVLVTVRLWLQMGAFMIIFLAGIQEIPRPLYEAATVDGARPGWQTFRHITFPQLRNTSVAVGLLLVITAIQAFDEFYNVFAGLSAGAGQGTAGSYLARPPMVYLYNVAFSDNDIGRGAAGTFVITALLILFVIWPARRLGFGREARD